MFCSHCGSKLENEAKFCHQCGQKVLTNGDVFEEIKQETTHLAEGNIPSEPAGDEQALRWFVGEKKENYYLKKWAKGDRSWNWAAFFLSYFWLGYRKIYKPILWVMGAYILLDLVIALLGIDSTKLNNAIGIAMGMSFGFWGNHLYRRHAEKVIKNVKGSYSDMESVKNEVRLRGGTSWLGVLKSIGIIAGYTALSILIFTYVPAINKAAEPANTVQTSVEKTNSKGDIEKDVKDLLQRNVQALEDENLDEYMSMIVDGTDQYDQTKEMLGTLFDHYDLDYSIRDIEFLSVTPTEVKVRVTQTTTLVEGEGFRDNQSVMVHTLKRQDGKWKIFNSVAEDIHYLDDEGAPDTTANTDTGTTTDTTAAPENETTPSVGLTAEDIVQQVCISCHGGNLEGGIGPALTNIGSKYSQDEIKEIILNGRGNMPGNLVSEDEAGMIAEWLTH
ncbi:DUF2628 domain-containing protein [Neobacillus mesonae]|uniref:DUF2628 domain-containing protein n=1 Tax=Neobacillus mesonae TaxID=1193713 RepID=UPI00204207BA|nr:DUF2628 domain-containing protein [Neobacillus mesonae]MCM3569349.1 DUF2628 domain-containing protein [Neobacillus mesonae]